MKPVFSNRLLIVFFLVVVAAEPASAINLKCRFAALGQGFSNFFARITGKTKLDESGLPAVPDSWFKYKGNHERVSVKLPKGMSLEQARIPTLFYELCKQDPDHAVLADDVRGVKTRRDIAAGVMTFLPYMKQGNERHIGVMLPPSGASTTTMMSIQLAGKVPAVINPTVGVRDMLKAIEISGLKKIYTSTKYVEAIRSSLKEDQVAAFDKMAKEHFVYLDKLAEEPSFKAQFALSQARAMLPPGTWVEFHSRRIDAVSMVLFTSGSSGVPKGVEVLHQNQIVNAMDLTASLPIEKEDNILGFLPHFHSFGATATYTLPLVSDARVAYAPNPKDLNNVSQVAGRYGSTFMIGTDTFLKFLAVKGKKEDLQYMKGAVFGAEPMNPKTVEALQKKIGAHFVARQGYGMTEAGPAIMVEDWQNPEPGTVGRPLAHVEVAVVEQQPDGSWKEVPQGEQGMLIVRGPNIMRGYLGGVPHETVTVNGKEFFVTGDIFSKTAKGNYKIHGRASIDFWKIGGEMVTRMKAQEVLQEQLGPKAGDNKKYVVMPDKSGDKIQNVLFTTDESIGPDDLPRINAAMGAGGLGSVYTIKRIVRLKKFPELGTGKQDLKTLKNAASGEALPPELLADGAR